MKRFLFLLLGINFCVFADSDSKYFEIQGIEVKQKGGNSLIAKQKALNQASRAALGKIIAAESGEKVSSVKSISDQQIQDCIYDYSIDQEKFSDLFYVGKISYRFSKSKAASLLRLYGINIKLPESEGKIVKLAVYLKDFIRQIHRLNKLKANVEKFSDTRVVFNIDKKYIDDFRQLRLKYAQLP